MLTNKCSILQECHVCRQYSDYSLCLGDICVAVQLVDDICAAVKLDQKAIYFNSFHRHCPAFICVTFCRTLQVIMSQKKKRLASFFLGNESFFAVILTVHFLRTSCNTSAENILGHRTCILPLGGSMVQTLHHSNPYL